MEIGPQVFEKSGRQTHTETDTAALYIDARFPRRRQRSHAFEAVDRGSSPSTALVRTPLPSGRRRADMKGSAWCNRTQGRQVTA